MFVLIIYSFWPEQVFFFKEGKISIDFAKQKLCINSWLHLTITYFLTIILVKTYAMNYIKVLTYYINLYLQGFFFSPVIQNFTLLWCNCIFPTFINTNWQNKTTEIGLLSVVEGSATNIFFVLYEAAFSIFSLQRAWIMVILFTFI